MTDRARHLLHDPCYLHEGRTYRLLLRGVPTDFFPVGALALALNRSVCQVRRLEVAGVIPPPEARYPGRTPHGQPRLYQRHEVLAIVGFFERQRLLNRRPQSWSERLLTPAA
jgi:hypothetical protein